MSASAAQVLANRENATHSTGPRTTEGKARASQNARKLGLFSATDFIRPEDQSAYDELCDAFWTELLPEGAIEQTHAVEIIRASWRLQRCSQIEAELATEALAAGIDPIIFIIENDRAIRTQTAVDRARNQSNTTIRRATAELRRIQSERQLRAELNMSPDMGLVDNTAVLNTMKTDSAIIALNTRNRINRTKAMVHEFIATDAGTRALVA